MFELSEQVVSTPIQNLGLQKVLLPFLGSNLNLITSSLLYLLCALLKSRNVSIFPHTSTKSQSKVNSLRVTRTTHTPHFFIESRIKVCHNRIMFQLKLFCSDLVLNFLFSTAVKPKCPPLPSNPKPSNLCASAPSSGWKTSTATSQAAHSSNILPSTSATLVPSLLPPPALLLSVPACGSKIGLRESSPAQVDG